jgi:membrane-bound serine protease (ClpP class)
MSSSRKMKRVGFVLLFLAASIVAWSQTATSQAYIVPIHGEINPSRMIFVRRGIEKAEADGADFIIFDIDTFGGRVDSALKIATLIGAARSATTVAFIPAAAESTGVSWSAGALISLACNRIYMAPGTSIGAAAPVYQTQTGMEMAEEKTVSAVRAQMAALAEKNGYPKAVAYAMVDLDVELVEIYLGDELILTSVDELPDFERQSERTGIAHEQGKTVSRSGKLLTLTAGEMFHYGISSGTVYDTDELLDLLGASPGDVIRLDETFADRAAGFVTGAVVTGLLVLIGLVTLYMEVTSPGFGVPGTIAIICFAVVFLGGALLGTVGSLELLLFLAGIILLIVEIFLIPGFGITGISGIVLIAVALVLSRQEFIWPEFTWEWDLFKRNLLIFGGSVVASVVFFGVIIRLFPHLPLFSRLILANPDESGTSVLGRYSAAKTNRSRHGREAVADSRTEADNPLPGVPLPGVPQPGSLRPGAPRAGPRLPGAGQRGVAVTILRPVGKAEFDGEVYEVKSDGEFVGEGAEIEIIEVYGNQILVKEC